MVLQGRVDINYINPINRIRSAAATPGDASYCEDLAKAAVQAAFSGSTGAVVGAVDDEFVLVPSKSIEASGVRRVDPKGSHWTRLTEAIGQPGLESGFLSSP